MATTKALRTDSPETLQKISRHCDADYQRLQAANPRTVDIASACLYWTRYPLLVAIIGDDRQTCERYNAYHSLNRVHRQAAELLCAVADREGIDGAAIYSAAEICRELFRWAPSAHRDGHYPYAWPDCLGQSRKGLAEHDQKTVRDGIAAYARLMTRLRSGANESSDRSGGLTKESKALALLVKHPEWTDTQIAKHVGCNRKSLYRWKQFVAAREILEKGRMDRPRADQI